MPLRWALVGSIAIISVAYPLAITQLDLPSDPTKESSSALFAQINILQSYGLYFVLLIPKLVITLLSQVVRFWKPISEPDRIHDLNNGLFVILDQLSLCLVLLAATVKKLWKTNGYLTYFCAICAVIYLSAPENSPRYLYILFVLLAIALAAPELQNSLSSRRAAILGLQLGNGQGHKSEWECPR